MYQQDDGKDKSKKIPAHKRPRDPHIKQEADPRDRGGRSQHTPQKIYSTRPATPEEVAAYHAKLKAQASTPHRPEDMPTPKYAESLFGHTTGKEEKKKEKK